MISDCDSVFNGAKVIDSEFQQQLGEPFSLLGCSFSLIDNMNLEKIVPKFSSTRSGAKVCICFGWNFIFQRSYRSRREVPIAVADSVVELPSIVRMLESSFNSAHLGPHLRGLALKLAPQPTGRRVRSHPLDLQQPAVSSVLAIRIFLLVSISKRFRNSCAQ